MIAMCGLRVIAAVTAAGLLAGCAGSSGGRLRAAGRHGADGNAEAIPLPERMRQTYPDLRSGRFLVLADFNTPRQADLFRIVGARGLSGLQPAITREHCIEATGPGGLAATLTSARDVLRLDGVRSESPTLPRDWRGFTLLLVNICGPPDGLTLDFAIHSGTEHPLRWSRRVFVRPGWHLYRYDLDRVGSAIDLADVRALSWQAPQLARPATLYFDDIILADNTELLTGADGAAQALYVRKRGRHLVVGSEGRFELALAEGVIVAWRAPGARGNQTVATGLGPWPVPLVEGWQRSARPLVYDDPALFASWGRRVRATQRVIEASPLRVVVEGRWRFVPAGGAANVAAAAPAHRWRYTIYADGRVYVRSASGGPAANWPAPLAGWAVALNGRAGFVRVAKPVPASPAGRQPRYVLLTQREDGRPDLLWVPHEPEAARLQVGVVSPDERRLAVLIGQTATDGPVRATHLLRLWPADIDDASRAAALAAPYQHPAAIEPTRGRVIRDAPGDADHDGFNEAEGCYELAPDGGVLRATLVPETPLLFRPVVRVHGTGGKTCWAYADGLVLRDAARDAAGNLLIVVPRVVDGPMHLEVNVANK